MNINAVNLAKKAGFIFWEDESWSPGKNKIDWSSNYDAELEKLIQEVVKTCADFCVENEYFNKYSVASDWAKQASKAFKNHFGIET